MPATLWILSCILLQSCRFLQSGRNQWFRFYRRRTFLFLWCSLWSCLIDSFSHVMWRAEGSIWIYVQKEFLMFAIKAFLFLYIFILSQPFGHMASMLKKHFNYFVYCIVLDILLILNFFMFVIWSCTVNKKKSKAGAMLFSLLGISVPVGFPTINLSICLDFTVLTCNSVVLPNYIVIVCWF